MAESKEQLQIEDLENKVKILTIKGGKNHADILALQASAGSRTVQTAVFNKNKNPIVTLPAMSVVASIGIIFNSTDNVNIDINTFEMSLVASDGVPGNIPLLNLTNNVTIINGDGFSTNGMTSQKITLVSAITNFDDDKDFSLNFTDNWPTDLTEVYFILETISLAAS